MFNLKFKLLAATAALLCAGTAFAQDSGPLIDMMVKKGLINDQEAEDLRADLVKDFVSTSAGKVSLGSTLTELKIAGDVRIRYEGRSGEVAGDELSRDRLRYRLRLGLSGKMVNSWAWGVRLETATGNRSSNVTMGDEAAGAFTKTSDGIFVGQVWTQWTPTPELTFTAGRMANPLVSTLMVWDADINPEGFAEQYKHRTGQLEYSGTFSQFLYNAANTQKLIGVASKVKDMGLLAYQGGLKYYTNSAGTSFFQVNPTFYQYIERSTANPAFYKGAFSPTNFVSVNNLFVFDLPVEYTWIASNGVPLRVFGDFAVNLDGADRARKYGRPDLENENKAYLVGFQYGKAVNKGEWDARIGYVSTGAFALDPNLVDSDIFDSRTNMEGWAFSSNYALGGATQLTLTYATGDRKNTSISAPGAGDIGTNNKLDNYQMLQLDLNVKF